jgi:hypothetical protein
VSEYIDNACTALEMAQHMINLTEDPDRKAELLIKLARGWQDVAVSEHWDAEIARAEAADAAAEQSVTQSAQEPTTYLHRDMSFTVGRRYADTDGDPWMIVGRTLEGVPLMGLNHVVGHIDAVDSVHSLAYVVDTFGLTGDHTPTKAPMVPVATQDQTRPVQVPEGYVPEVSKTYRAADGETYWRVSGTLDDGTVIMRDWHGYIGEWGVMVKTWDQVLEDDGPLTFDRDTP